MIQKKKERFDIPTHHFHKFPQNLVEGEKSPYRFRGNPGVYFKKVYFVLLSNNLNKEWFSKCLASKKNVKKNSNIESRTQNRLKNVPLELICRKYISEIYCVY